jgi:hypothetical protein
VPRWLARDPCVHDQGHNWPNTGYGCDGGVCFDAGPAIWSFFSKLQPEV